MARAGPTLLLLLLLLLLITTPHDIHSTRIAFHSHIKTVQTFSKYVSTVKFILVVLCNL